MLRRLTHTLLTLFALQTTLAMADVHQWHPLSNDHTQTHLVDQAKGEITHHEHIANHAFDNNSQDCTQCDHNCCHGAHGTPIVGREIMLVIASPAIQIPQHTTTAPIARNASLYRPPIC